MCIHIFFTKTFLLVGVHRLYLVGLLYHIGGTLLTFILAFSLNEEIDGIIT